MNVLHIQEQHGEKTLGVALFLSFVLCGFSPVAASRSTTSPTAPPLLSSSPTFALYWLKPEWQQREYAIQFKIPGRQAQASGFNLRMGESTATCLLRGFFASPMGVSIQSATLEVVLNQVRVSKKIRIEFPFKMNNDVTLFTLPHPTLYVQSRRALFIPFPRRMVFRFTDAHARSLAPTPETEKQWQKTVIGAVTAMLGEQFDQSFQMHVLQLPAVGGLAADAFLASAKPQLLAQARQKMMEELNLTHLVATQNAALLHLWSTLAPLHASLAPHHELALEMVAWSRSQGGYRLGPAQAQFQKPDRLIGERWNTLTAARPAQKKITSVEALGEKWLWLPLSTANHMLQKAVNDAKMPSLQLPWGLSFFNLAKGDEKAKSAVQPTLHGWVHHEFTLPRGELVSPSTPSATQESSKRSFLGIFFHWLGSRCALIMECTDQGVTPQSFLAASESDELREQACEHPPLPLLDLQNQMKQFQDRQYPLVLVPSAHPTPQAPTQWAHEILLHFIPKKK